MSQNDFNLANQGFPSMRADMNSALQALASNSAGTSAPATTYAHQWWYDSTNNILKMRNADNDAWINFASFDQAADAWSVASLTNLSVSGTGLFSGRLGVGSQLGANPSAADPGGDNFVIDAGGADVGITLDSDTTAKGSIFFADGSSGDNLKRGQIVYNHSGDYMAFATNATERMRIDSSGKLLSPGGSAFVGTVATGSTNGAIIERGSNANGEYVRFADGTQICTLNVSSTVLIATSAGAIYQGDSFENWVYPAAFSAVPTVTGSANATWIWITVGAVVATNCNYHGLSYKTNPEIGPIRLMAIGRWF